MCVCEKSGFLAGKSPPRKEGAEAERGLREPGCRTCSGLAGDRGCRSRPAEGPGPGSAGLSWQRRVRTDSERARRVCSQSRFRQRLLQSSAIFAGEGADLAGRGKPRAELRTVSRSLCFSPVTGGSAEAGQPRRPVLVRCRGSEGGWSRNGTSCPGAAAGAGPALCPGLITGCVAARTGISARNS